MDGYYQRGRNNKQLNVLGGDLEPCLSSKNKNEIVTGFYRDNCCNTGPDDFGLHTVCCIITKSFLINRKITLNKSILSDLNILSNTDNELKIYYDKSKIKLDKIINLIQSQNIEIIDIISDDGSLEDVFFKLTNE